ncbi:MAG TPA: acyl-CoA dehydrogenase family protein [Mycobacteriales bacterium]|nr:acyl-CoA dehydrogenase family protein [Mycobacteriales bacterium]
MDAADRKLFGDSLRQAVAGSDHADAALAALDWRAALADDPAGATRVVFAILGELNLASSAIDDVLTYALGLEPSEDRAVVLPSLGGHLPPATYERAEVTVDGLATTRITVANQAIVTIDGGKQMFLSRLSPEALDVTAIDGIDPAAGWRRIHGTAKVSDLKAIDWDRALTAGQLALAQQLTSAARAMLGLATEHAKSRSQFDRSIGSFQAVRHKLAESLVAIEGADAALDAGWANPSPFAAMIAKSIAGSAAKTVAKHAQQVLAGMGFTSEHPFPGYLKRTMVLDQLLGSSASLRAEIGRSVVESGEIPKLLPL